MILVVIFLNYFVRRNRGILLAKRQSPLRSLASIRRQFGVTPAHLPHRVFGIQKAGRIAHYKFKAVDYTTVERGSAFHRKGCPTQPAAPRRSRCVVSHRLVPSSDGTRWPRNTISPC
ncbi:MAG TPA: hypothetical protein DD670_05745 [Planctomycetaceae bacterium]|nr:hypothetical protein [Planctomycetaceae bacterium]